MMTSSDDFSRADTANLGSGWSSTCRGFGTSIPAYTADSSYVDVDFSVSVVDPAERVMVPVDGGWVELGDVCPACTRRWEKDDVATSRNQQPFRHTDCDDPKLNQTDIQIEPAFDLGELITWLETARARWGHVTGRLEGTGINIYQDGRYRAAIDLSDERPCLSHWADDDA